MLTDFGLSKRSENLDELNRSFCGTPAYLPLEIINKKGHNRMADWYEYGVVLYELYTGFPPFYADTKAELYDLVRAGVIRFPKNTPETFRDLIKRLLNQNPERRLGCEKDAESIKEHPWFADVDWEEVLDRKLQMPPIDFKLKIGDPIKTKFHDVKSEKFQIPMWSFIS